MVERIETLFSLKSTSANKTQKHHHHGIANKFQELFSHFMPHRPMVHKTVTTANTLKGVKTN